MSKNIIIQEGGVGRQLTADKLKTALVGGGSCLWIPEDEAKLGTKSITEDGTYDASDDGLYGFSSVTVRGIGKVTGKDPVTGEETQITTEKDPQTGEPTIKTKVIPSSIRIVTPPTRLEYNDGDLIDFSGMYVKAFLKSGELFEDESYPYGIIPDSELDKPVQVAKYTGGGGSSSETRGLLPQPISYIVKDSYTGTAETSISYVVSHYSVTVPAHLFRTLSATKASVYYAAKTDFTVTRHTTSSSKVSPEDEPIHTTETYRPQKVTVNGDDFYYLVISFSVNPEAIPISEVPTVAAEGANIYDAWIVLYGDQSSQSIPVNWLCPYGDNKTLTDSFSITVNAAPEPDPDPDDGVDAVTGADPVAGGETP